MPLNQTRSSTNHSPPLISHNENIGSEVPLCCCDSFPPGEAKGQSHKMVPFNEPLNSVMFGAYANRGISYRIILLLLRYRSSSEKTQPQYF